MFHFQGFFSVSLYQTHVITDKMEKNLVTQITQIISGNVSRIDDNFIMIDNVKKLNTSAKHLIKLNAITIGVCFSGELTVEINGVENHICPGKLIITLVNDIIQFKNVSPNAKGLILIISQNFLEDALKKVNDILSLYLYIQKYPCINLSIEECTMIQNFYNFFDLQLNYKHPCPYQSKIVSSILESFIYYITSIFSIDKNNNQHNRNEEIFREFIQLVIRHFKKKQKLDFYAQNLYVSTKYLCNIIKTTSGHTPKEWINHYTILEAKLLLQTTNMTTEQISNELNFPNASFFCKFFKKNVGMTTKEYRMSL